MQRLGQPLSSPPRSSTTLRLKLLLQYVRPTGEIRLVQAQREGIVTSIEVTENQPVQRGDVIARLDDSRLQTQASQLEENISNGSLQLSQLDARVRTIERQILAETNRIEGAVASARAELEQSQRDYQDKQLTTRSQVQEARANVRLAREDLHKARAELRSATANLKSSEAALAAAQTKQNRYQPLAEVGAIALERLEEVQLEAQQQQQAVVAELATVEGQKQLIERQKQALATARAKLDSALVRLNPSDAMVAIASEQIVQTQAQGEASLANLHRERSALLQNRLEIQKQLSSDRKELQQTQSDLAHSILRATSDGIILKSELRNAGQVISSSDTIAQIAPDGTSLAIEAQVTPKDIKKVEVGQEVQLRVSACPYPDYGTLKEVVTAISPDVMVRDSVDAATQTQTTSYFETTVRPDRLALVNGQRQCQIQAGIEAEADIISRSETALQFILRKARLLTDL